MLTLATVDIPGEAEKDYRIYVDIDDSGWAYLKQGDDWVCFPCQQVVELIGAMTGIDPGTPLKAARMVPGGACATCQGEGRVGINYTDAEELECEDCDGTGFAKDVPVYRGRQRLMKFILDLAIAVPTYGIFYYVCTHYEWVAEGDMWKVGLAAATLVAIRGATKETVYTGISESDDG